MPKVKVARKSTWVDMTAMCDVAFLLLTFFILTSNFIQKELVQVVTPTSISEIKVPEVNVMNILVGKDGKVVLGIDNEKYRRELLDKIAKAYSLTFTPKQIEAFGLSNTFGVPVNYLGSVLDMNPEKRYHPENVIGIPSDSTNNQFKEWVRYARQVNPQIKIVIKADKDTPYKKIKDVLGTLQGLNENRYQLITGMEEAPKLPKS
ncbi:ExbD/TolR family protein [Alistipes sp. ZOR0009]|jgi:biopolymer transport protein ExbD|uniref:ExbD/TolR family protein n=1 Tax=Alistipes sp. ZOR0009 TaxID=1339253 RepID=UPI00064820A0|nr:biopolymer transporter ExbD [Alistipes sp. ZOR0009]